MKTILIKENGVIEVKDCNLKTLSLKQLKENLELGDDIMVELAQRKIGRKYFDLWIDEEGRCKDLKPTLITEYEDFRGNVLILRSKGEHSIPLNDEEVESVISILQTNKGVYFNNKPLRVVATSKFDY